MYTYLSGQIEIFDRYIQQLNVNKHALPTTDSTYPANNKNSPSYHKPSLLD